MAEGLFNKKIRDLGIAQLFEVESRATSSKEVGSQPHPETQKVLKRENANLLNKIATQITEKDMKYFDEILVMDNMNVRDLSKMFFGYREKMKLIRSINPNVQQKEIADPYYTLNYEVTYQALHEDLDLWIAHFMKT